MKKDRIVVDGVEYVRADALAKASDKEGMPFVIVRTYSAGVFAGYLASRSDDGKQVEVREARRLWYWAGAASLSQLAVDGVSKPKDCKFPVAVPSVTLTEAIEVLPVSAKAKQIIDEVPIWEM